MVLNFTLWSPLISLLAISFLYPLRLHYRGHKVSQIYAAIFAFPALVSSLYIFNIVYTKGTISSKTIHTSHMPVFLTLHISSFTAMILLMIFTSIVIIIFIPSKKDLTETLSLSSLSFVIIFVISAMPDQLVAVSILSIGSMLASFMLLHDYNTPTTKMVLTDFLLQRISDFLALFALIFTLAISEITSINNPMSAYKNPYYLSMLLFNISTLIRVGSIVLYRQGSINNGYLLGVNSIMRKLIIGVGSLILLIQFPSMVIANGPLHSFLLASAILLLVLAIGRLIFYRNLTGFVDDLANVFIAGALVASIVGIYLLSVALIGAVIVLYPITIMHGNAEYDPKVRHSSNQFFSQISLWLLSTKTMCFKILFKTANLFAKFFINLINPFYSSICFYYLPQISIAIPQIPLRLFHTGNIQRSLIFAAIIIVSYAYLWGK